MRRRHTEPLCLAVLFAFIHAGALALACDDDATEQARTATLASKPAAPGLRAYIDPQTGEFTVAPPAGEAAASLAVDSELSTSSDGLGVAPAPGGGLMIDLQGRFQSEVRATLKADGTVSTECGTLPSTAGTR